MPVTKPSIQNIESAVLNLWGKGVHSAIEARQRGLERAQIIRENLADIMPAVLNTNTVSTDLKRTVILQSFIRAFAVRALPLLAFTVKFDAVRLEGTNKIAIPYFPLNTTASNNWDANTGYAAGSFSNSNSDAKVIDVDKRKWTGLKFTSDELARQPIDVDQNLVLTAQQLCLDVVNDILSLITASAFGDPAHSQPAGSFDSDDVVELKGVADGLNWPIPGRSLVLNSTYDVNLLKDPSVKRAADWGDDGPIKEGRILNIGGFNYFPDARVPGNSENLEGFITQRSGILVGFAPIGPSEEVRQQLSRYEVLVEPETGVTLEYRAFGNATLDTAYHTAEANYGRVVGNTAALKRITNQ